MIDSVLVVDDEVELASLVMEILEGAGYIVDSAPNGREALAKLKSGKFAVVLSDLSMPEKDGLTFLQESRELGFETPFILFSGMIGKAQLLRAHQWGVFGILEKPASPGKILDAVGAALEYGHLVEAVNNEIQRIFQQYGVPEADREKLLGLERALAKQRVMGHFLHL